MARLFAIVTTLLSLSVALFRGTSAHGLMVDPPGRNTVLNYQRLGTQPRYSVVCDKNTYGQVNYNDRSNFCGGRGTQNANDGKCSACGDDWSAPYPRKHDVGGTLIKRNIPTRVYWSGQVFTARISITAQHLGNFEFRLCTLNEADEKRAGRNDELTKCFEDASRYIVLRTEDGDTRYTGPNGRIDVARYYNVNLRLPQGVTCPRGCSLQWRYEAGNNNDQLKYQEHFINCADIIIASCADYKSGNIAEYCGFGPTDELRQCDGGTGSQPPAPPSGGGSQNGDNTTTTNGGQTSPPFEGETNNEPKWDDGDNDNEPYGGTQDTDNGKYGGEQDSYNEQNGDTQNTDNEPSLDTQNTDNAANSASQESEDPYSPPYQNKDTATTSTCTECSGLNCDNPCCDLRVVGVTGHLSGWCEQNCKHIPPFCPTSHCRTSWVMNSRCSRQLMLRDLLRGLLGQEKQGDTQETDGDGGQYGK